MTKGMTTQQTISILGSGWLGLPLAEHLVKQGYSVNLSTRDTAKFPALQQVGANPCLFDTEQITDEMMVFLQADL